MAHSSRFDRVRTSLSTFTDYPKLTAGLVLLLLFYFNVIPILTLVFGSFFSQEVSLVSSFTTANWITMFTKVPSVFWNTITYSIGSALLTTVLSALIGYVLARTNTPFSTLYYYIFFVVMFSPPIMWERVWVFLLGRNGVYATLLHFNFNVYSIPGMILIQGIHLIPLGLVLLMPMYSNMDASLEEAAFSAGATRREVLWDVTLPLIAPGILMVFVLSLIIALGSFRVPLVIGLAHKIIVLPTFIYNSTQTVPFNYGAGMASAVLLVVLGVPLLFLYYKALGAIEKYQTVTGGGYSQGSMDVGRWRYVLSALVGLLTIMLTIIPVLMIIYISVIPYYASPLSGNIPQFTLAGYIGVLNNTRSAIQGLMNSALIAVVSTSLLLVTGVLISWLVAKTDLPLKREIDYLSFLPMGIPSVALALGLLFVYLYLFPIGVYGTYAILVIAFVTRYLPATVRIVYPSVVQIHDELIDASRVSGAGSASTIYSIVAPLIGEAARAIYSIRFALIFMEMPMAMMLRTPQTRMISTVFLALDQQGQYSIEAALGVIAMAIILAIVIAVHQVGQRHDIDTSIRTSL